VSWNGLFQAWPLNLTTRSIWLGTRSCPGSVSAAACCFFRSHSTQRWCCSRPLIPFFLQVFSGPSHRATPSVRAGSSCWHPLHRDLKTSTSSFVDAFPSGYAIAHSSYIHCASAGDDGVFPEGEGNVVFSWKCATSFFPGFSVPGADSTSSPRLAGHRVHARIEPSPLTSWINGSRLIWTRFVYTRVVPCLLGQVCFFFHTIKRTTFFHRCGRVFSLEARSPLLALYERVQR